MKKLLVASLLSVLVVGNASAFFFGGRGGRCGTCAPSCARTTYRAAVCEEPAPVCYKMVRKECPAQKICETTCHYVCPPDTIREDGAGECD